MRAVVATSRAYHLHHLAIELARHGWEIEFHSYLPRWRTRQLGLPDRQTVSHFLALLPLSALAFLRIDRPWVRQARRRLAAAVDRRIARTMGRADLIGNGKHQLIPSRQPITDGSYVSPRRANSTPAGSGGAKPVSRGTVLTQHTGLPPRPSVGTARPPRRTPKKP